MQTHKHTYTNINTQIQTHKKQIHKYKHINTTHKNTNNHTQVLEKSLKNTRCKKFGKHFTKLMKN